MPSLQSDAFLTFIFLWQIVLKTDLLSCISTIWKDPDSISKVCKDEKFNVNIVILTAFIETKNEFQINIYAADFFNTTLLFLCYSFGTLTKEKDLDVGLSRNVLLYPQFAAVAVLVVFGQV